LRGRKRRYDPIRLKKLERVVPLRSGMSASVLALEFGSDESGEEYRLTCELTHLFSSEIESFEITTERSGTSSSTTRRL